MKKVEDSRSEDWKLPKPCETVVDKRPELTMQATEEKWPSPGDDNLKKMAPEDNALNNTIQRFIG